MILVFFLAHINVRPSLVQQVKDAQMHDPQLTKVIDEIKLGYALGFLFNKDCALRYGTRLCVPNVDNLRKELMTQTYKTTYIMHPSSTNKYKDLKEYYWWESMKRDMVEFVSRCLLCQQIKIEHKLLTGLRQPLLIPKWKWEQIPMDLVC